ncbi:hypothetical protein ACP70R_019730 [Stipagrostis hirtigluma subsp. patula]
MMVSGLYLYKIYRFSFGRQMALDHAQDKKAMRHPGASTPRGAIAMASASLPAELLLEIVARSDAATFMRCAAACKSLRRDILSPAFVRRVCRAPDGIFPARLLGLLDKAFSSVHPATPAAVSFASNHLAPLVSRAAAGLLEQYKPVTSRGGLVLLERRGRAIDDRQQPRAESHRADELCVYNPITGDRAFLPLPPDIGRDSIRGRHNYTYVLLTAADGIVGCSFLLLAADMNRLNDPSGHCIRVQTVSSDAGGQWGPVTRADTPRITWSDDVDGHKAGVVLGGVVHWLVYHGKCILTYDVMGTAKAGRIKLSKDHYQLYACDCHLGSWPDGRLSLFGIEMFRVSVWVLCEGGWARHAAVETMAALRSLLAPSEMRVTISGFCYYIQLVSYDDRRSGVALLWASKGGRGVGDYFVVDMETTEIHRIVGAGEMRGTLYEVDVPSWLSTMKAFD